MLWQLPVALRFLIAFVFAQIIIKKISGSHSRTKRLFLQFLFCAIGAFFFAIGAHFIFGHKIVTTASIFIAAIGFINAFAAYCQWRAVHISLSKTSLFTFGDDVIAISLAYIVLNEGRFVTNIGWVGICVSLAAAVSLVIYRYPGKAKEQRDIETKEEERVRLEKEQEKKYFLLWVGIYSLIWGTVPFVMRYFALKDMSIGTFLLPWYGAAAAGSFLLMRLYKEKGSGAPQPFKHKDVGIVALLSLCIGASLATAYWAVQLAPVTIVQPLFLAGEMVIPALVGLIIFRERKGVTKAEMLLFGAAFAGGIILALSF